MILKSIFKSRTFRLHVLAKYKSYYILRIFDVNINLCKEYSYGIPIILS